MDSPLTEIFVCFEIGMIKVGMVQSEFTPVDIKTSVTFLKRKGTSLVE
jgi:hypothetical protein